jgi:hypothetical protein
MYRYRHVGTPYVARKDASAIIGQLKKVVLIASARD